MKKRAPNPRQVTPIPAVEDYPRNQAELDARFGSAEACGAYLIQVRWPDGFQRPTCSHRKGWPVCGLFLQCAACGWQTSIAADMTA